MRALVLVVLAAAVGGLLYWVAVEGVAPTRDAPVEAEVLHGVPQGHVYTSVLEEPVTLNPFETGMAPGVIGGVFRYTYEGLVDWDPATGDLRGAAAESWEVSEDGRTVRFAMREGLCFANGEPVTAADLTFCWDLVRIHGLALVGSRLGAVLDEVRAVRFEGPAPGVLEIELAAAGPRLLGFVGSGYWILSRAEFERHAGVPVRHPEFLQQLEDYRAVAMGTGPYQVAPGGWAAGSDLLLTRNRHAWHRDARPGCWNLAGIRWRFPQALGEPELALREGLLDIWVSRGQGLLDVPEIAAHYRYVEYVHPLLQPYRVEWNLRDPALADADVRRALALLTDRDALVSQALGGTGQPATGPFSPRHPGSLPHDPRGDDWERGRALLVAAGFDGDHPLELELLAPSSDPLFGRIAAFLTDAWRGAGVRVTTETLEFSVCSERVNSRNFQGVLTMDQDPFPFRDLYPYLHSSQVDGLNDPGYASDDADRALEAVRSASDVDGQRRAEAELASILDRDQPVLWLFHRKVGVLLHERVKGAEVGAMGLSPERFWVEPSRQRSR